jgi:putative transcriptional regulator
VKAALALASLNLLAAVVAAPAQERPPAPSVTGRLLVATEKIGDPRFFHTVIYMVRHDENGAMGVVVNRPLGEVPLARLLADLGLDAAGAPGDVRVHYGGPVEPARGLVLHTSDYVGRGTVPLEGSVALTPESGIFRDMAAGRGPRLSIFTLGYAGWTAGQLESEMDSGAWVTVRADAALVFDEDSAKKWQRALARSGLDL